MRHKRVPIRLRDAKMFAAVFYEISVAGPV